MASRAGSAGGDGGGDFWYDWVLPVGLGAALSVVLVAALRPRRSPPRFAGPVVPGGRVLSRFGPRTKQGVTRPHWGIDLQAPQGTPIMAAADGTVMGVWPDGRVQGYGNMVTIKHRDGEGSLYAHMDSIDPAMVAGAAVRAGQVVGSVGCTDSEGGFPCSYAHLHFEVLTPTPGDDRAYVGVRGGEDPYPLRADPAAWAAGVGVALV